MSKLDDELNIISSGLTPELIQFKSKEYNDEFNQFQDEYMKEQGIDSISAKVETQLFRSFICHKVAALEVVVNHILGITNEEETE